MRVDTDGKMYHLEDEKYRVQLTCPDREIIYHYAGEEGKLHLVRAKRPDGSIGHYEGCKGEERHVRTVFADGAVKHYEGLPSPKRRVV